MYLTIYAIYVTSFSVFYTEVNSEYLSQYGTQNGNIHSIKLNVHGEKQSASNLSLFVDKMKACAPQSTDITEVQQLHFIIHKMKEILRALLTNMDILFSRVDGLFLIEFQSNSQCFYVMEYLRNW